MNDSHPPCELKLGCRCRGVPGAAVAVSVDADENVVVARSEGFEDASSPNPNAGARPPPAAAGKDDGLSGSMDESCVAVVVVVGVFEEEDDDEVGSNGASSAR